MITNEAVRHDFVANGTQTAFPFQFLITDKTHLQVYDNTTLKVVDTDYTVTGVGNESGGVVTFTVAPLVNHAVIIVQDVPETQTTDMGQSVTPESVETSLDKMTMIAKQLGERINRCLRFPITAQNQGVEIPSPLSSYIGKFLRAKSDGLSVEWADVTPAGSIAVPVAVADGGTGSATGLGNLVYGADYATLNAAITAIGGNVRTLLINTVMTCNANVTCPSNVHLLFRGLGQISVNTGVTLTISGAVEARPSKQIFAGSGTVVLAAWQFAYPAWFGAVGDGTTDDAAALQDFLDCGAKDLRLHPVIYALETGLTMVTKNAINLHGSGCTGISQTNGTILKWTGGAGGVMLTCTGVQDCRFANFQMTVGDAPSTLTTGIDFDPTGRAQVETNCIFENVAIVQRGGLIAPDSSLGIGVRLSRSTSAGNVDNFKFYNLQIAGASVAGVSIEHAQSKNHTFHFCNITYSDKAISTNENSSTGGSFNIFGGDFGHCDTADIDLGPPSNNIEIYGLHSEASERFLTATYGMTNATFQILLHGVSLTGSASLPVDGQCIQIGNTSSGGPAGPLVLINCDLYASETDVTAKIGYAQNSGVILSLGNSFNGSTGASPFVRNAFGGSTESQIISIGDRVFNGAAFVLLPTLALMNQYLEGSEISDPAAPAANSGRLYFKDNGAGKTQLVCRFASGAVQAIATEP